MEIRGPNNAHRSDVDRASDSRKADRQKNAKAAISSEGDATVEGDRIDTSASELIDRSVDGARRALEDRLTDVTERREELLARADDPEAVRRAAEEFLKSQRELPGVFD